MTELNTGEAERYRTAEEERRAKVRAAEVASVRRALNAASHVGLDPTQRQEYAERLVDALQAEEWERGCRCYPAEVG